jgi:hypothetical protein
MKRPSHPNLLWARRYHLFQIHHFPFQTQMVPWESPLFLMLHLAHRPRHNQHLLELCLWPLRTRGEHQVHRHLRIILMMTLSHTHHPKRLNQSLTKLYIRPHHPTLLLPLPLHTVIIIVNAAALVTSTLSLQQFFLLYHWRGILIGIVLLSCCLCLVHLGVRQGHGARILAFTMRIMRNLCREAAGSELLSC